MKRFALIALVFGFVFFGCDTGDGTATYTVTFDLDGGNISGSTISVKITVKSGETVSSLPNPQKADNSFDGWFAQKNGVGNEFTTSTEVTSNLTVYAKWTPDNTNSPYAGTWSYNALAFIIDVNNNFVQQYEQENVAKGTVVVNSGIIAFTFNAVWVGSEWKSDQATLDYYATNILGGSLTITGTISGSSSGSTISLTVEGDSFTLTKNGNGNFENVLAGNIENAQVFSMDGNTIYTGNGTIKGSLENDYEIVVGTLTNGKLTINLPETLNESFLVTSWQTPSNDITVIPANPKVAFLGSFALYENNTLIGWLYYGKWTDIEQSFVQYMYFPVDTTINGFVFITEMNVKQLWSVNGKTGWNALHRNDYDTNEGSIWSWSTDFDSFPSDAKWFIILNEEGPQLPDPVGPNELRGKTYDGDGIRKISFGTDNSYTVTQR